MSLNSWNSNTYILITFWFLHHITDEESAQEAQKIEIVSASEIGNWNSLNIMSNALLKILLNNYIHLMCKLNLYIPAIRLYSFYWSVVMNFKETYQARPAFAWQSNDLQECGIISIPGLTGSLIFLYNLSAFLAFLFRFLRLQLRWKRLNRNNLIPRSQINQQMKVIFIFNSSEYYYD